MSFTSSCTGYQPITRQKCHPACKDCRKIRVCENVCEIKKLLKERERIKMIDQSEKNKQCAKGHLTITRNKNFSKNPKFKLKFKIYNYQFVKYPMVQKTATVLQNPETTLRQSLRIRYHFAYRLNKLSTIQRWLRKYQNRIARC